MVVPAGHVVCDAGKHGQRACGGTASGAWAGAACAGLDAGLQRPRPWAAGSS